MSDFPGGWIVGSGRATTQTINEFLDRPDLRRQLGEEGRAACVAKYNWNEVMAAYESVFERLLQP